MNNDFTTNLEKYAQAIALEDHKVAADAITDAIRTCPHPVLYAHLGDLRRAANARLAVEALPHWRRALLGGAR